MIFSTNDMRFDYICIASSYVSKLVEHGKDFLNGYEVCAIFDTIVKESINEKFELWYDKELQESLLNSNFINNIIDNVGGCIIFKNKNNDDLTVYDATNIVSMINESISFCHHFNMNSFCDLEIACINQNKNIIIFHIDSST